MDDDASSYSSAKGSYHNVELDETNDTSGHEPREAMGGQRSIRRDILRTYFQRLAIYAAVPLAILLLVILAVKVALVGSATHLDPRDTGNAFGCGPNGDVWADVEPSIWKSKYLLSITLRLGRFSYSRAKTIRFSQTDMRPCKLLYEEEKLMRRRQASRWRCRSLPK